VTPVDIELIGASEVEADVKGVAERSSDARPAMRLVRDLMREGIKKNFETSGAYLGDSWRQLAPGTLARKAREGKDAKPLVADGGLEAALTGGKGKTSSATRTQAKAGISLWYGVFAQSGASGDRKGTEPARKIIGFTRRNQLKAGRMVEDYIISGEA
jgi:phage gpG-like protein